MDISEPEVLWRGCSRSEKAWLYPEAEICSSPVAFLLVWLRANSSMTLAVSSAVSPSYKYKIILYEVFWSNNKNSSPFLEISKRFSFLPLLLLQFLVKQLSLLICWKISSVVLVSSVSLLVPVSHFNIWTSLYFQCWRVMAPSVIKAAMNHRQQSGLPLCWVHLCENIRGWKWANPPLQLDVVVPILDEGTVLDQLF